MKSNKLLIALALCAAMQPGISFGTQSQSYLQRAQNYAASWVPQFMQDTHSAIAKKYEETIGKWSTKNKLILLGAILTTLGVGAYYRNEIMQIISDALAGKVEGNIPPQKPELTGGNNIPVGETPSKELPRNELVHVAGAPVEDLLRDFERRVEDYLIAQKEYVTEGRRLQAESLLQTNTRPALRGYLIIDSLENISRALSDKAEALSFDLIERGVTKDQLRAIVAEARRKVSAW
jgi:hypothetical protein